MDPKDPPECSSEVENIYVSLDDTKTSEFGLDWSDISLIRQKLELTPTERLRAAQTLINTAIRIRADNG